MGHLTHTQLAWAWAAVFAGLVWTAFWAWIWWMAFRVLRWTYLEKRQQRRAGMVPARVEAWHAGGSDAGVGSRRTVYSGPGW